MTTDLKLPRLTDKTAVTDTSTGKALLVFTRLWDALCRALEAKIDTIVAGGTYGPAGICFVIDGQSTVIGTGIKGYLSVPFNCTINSSTLLADQSGSIVVNIYKCTYSQFNPTTHPAVGDKITASAPPTISSAKKASDTTLTGWTITITAGDVLGFNVDSCATITKATITLGVTKTL